LFVPMIFLIMLKDEHPPSSKVIYNSYLLVIVVFGMIASMHGSSVLYSNKHRCMLSDNSKIRMVLVTWGFNIFITMYSLIELILY